jgi:hypothetical protein
MNLQPRLLAGYEPQCDILPPEGMCRFWNLPATDVLVVFAWLFVWPWRSYLELQSQGTSWGLDHLLTGKVQGVDVP